MTKKKQKKKQNKKNNINYNSNSIDSCYWNVIGVK